MVKWNAKEVRVLPFIVRRDSGPFVLQDVELWGTFHQDGFWRRERKNGVTLVISPKLGEQAQTWNSYTVWHNPVSQHLVYL